MHNQRCIDTNQDVNLALLQISSTPVGGGIPSLATMLFKRSMEGLLPQMNRTLINIDDDNVQYETLETYQNKYI